MKLVGKASNQKYHRKCPACGKETIYSYSGFYNANRYNKNCQQCYFSKMQGSGNPFFGKHHSDETKNKLKNRDVSHTQTEEFRLAIKKGMVGKKCGGSIYKVWEKLPPEERLIKVQKWKEKHKRNAIGRKNHQYGKPAPVGSGNGWSGWYNKFYFRSLLELTYLIKYIENNNKKWITGELYKIPYVDYFGRERTYRPDFIINNEFMIECKPRKLWKSPLILCKTKAAIKFCKQNNLKFRLVDCQKLSNKEICNLVNNKQVKFLHRYYIKYLEKYGPEYYI